MRMKHKFSIILSILAALFPGMTYSQSTKETVIDPEVEFFKAPGEKANGKTILILPGGGYTHHAMDHEGYDWVPFFHSKGINVAILKYKLPEGNATVPFNDVKSTFHLLKEKGKEWNINPDDIGIMGFSAGGHLASTYATHSSKEDKPSFQILFYPVVSFKSDLTHKGSRDSLLGSHQSDERILLYSNEEQVDESTPPAILFHSNDDGLVVPDNSINYYQALRRNGIPASLHIYPSGQHGWGFRETFPYHEVMLNELSLWLDNL